LPSPCIGRHTGNKSNISVDNSGDDPTPSSSGNNNYIDDLLNGDSGTSGSTVPQLMGYNFVPPPPSKPQMNFPYFNVVDAMSEGVFQQADGKSSASNAINPLIPPSDDNIEKRPHEPPSADLESTPDLMIFPPPDPQHDPLGRGSDAEWKEFHDDWATANDTIVQALADLVTGAFGWGDPTTPQASAIGGPPRAVLSGNRPDQLLANQAPHDDFSKYYMSCPWITVS
jgi:hypothetical protein